MLKSNEQIKVEAQKSIDVALDLVTTSVQSIEKLTHIHLETSRQLLAEATKTFREAVVVTDSKDVLARVNAVANQAIEKNIASVRDVFDVVNEVQIKINKITEGNLEHIQQSALNSVEGFAQYNPSGAEVAGNLVRAWIQNSNQALAALNKVSAQVSEYANSNIDAATNAALKATKKANTK